MAARIDNVAVGISAGNSTLTVPCDYVKVTSIDGAGRVYFRVDGTAAATQADENYAIPAIAGRSKTVKVPRGWNGITSLIASAATECTVEGVSGELEHVDGV